jgi:hypothetical protein
MGIDYEVKSTVDDSFNQAMGMNKYLKYAWKDIEWERILEMIHFNINILYDNKPSFWATEQLDYVCKELEQLTLGNYENILEYDECEKMVLPNIEHLKKDITKLYHLFQEYVDKKCIILVY